MTTLNTIEDLLQVLRDNEAIRSAVRRELLTEDLLDLPRRFDVLQENQNVLQENQNAMQETQNAMLETQNAMLEVQNEILRRLENMEAHYGRLSQDFSAFRGNYAESAAVKNATDIAILFDQARGIGLDETSVRVLSGDDLRALAREYGVDRLAAIPLADRRSYYGADLVAEAATLDGAVFYIVAQASYTCNGRDTSRAISNAGLLAEFTGRDAWPVIAGVRMDRNIRPLVAAADMFWYQLEVEELEPSEPA